MAALLLLGIVGAPVAARSAPASVVRIQLGAESEEHQPFTVPTGSADTVEVDFPWPVDDWAGRGFTPDPAKYSGDFVVEATRGNPRIFVTPLSENARRVLHIVLAGPAGESRSLPVEFIPAPPGLAWRKVIFAPPGPKAEATPPVRLASSPPKSRLRQPGADSELGLLETMRLLLNSTAAGAEAIVGANPSLDLKRLDSAPQSFGDYTIACRFALRDGTTDTLGLCVAVANATNRRLAFDPASWVVRAGSRVYAVQTVSFANELDPGMAAPAFLILGRGPDGEATRLLPDNAFGVSVLSAGSADPRPVQRLPLSGFPADE